MMLLFGYCGASLQKPFFCNIACLYVEVVDLVTFYLYFLLKVLIQFFVNESVGRIPQGTRAVTNQFVCNSIQGLGRALLKCEIT